MDAGSIPATSTLKRNPHLGGGFLLSRCLFDVELDVEVT